MDQYNTPARRTHSRSFSARSDKSSEKQGPPTPSEIADKNRRDSFMRGESKANPNAAITEAQPQARNVLEKVTLDSLRDIQHKDADGNIISEPDLSNPTRPRWERPLDTIRSFERARDGGYKRRSMSRAASDFDGNQNQYQSRRSSSYFGGSSQQDSYRYQSTAYRHNAGYDSGPSPSRNSHYGGGYYGGRRPDSYHDPYGYAPNGPQPRQRYGQRGMSEGNLNRSSYYNGSGYNGPSNANGNGNGGNNHFNQTYDASGSDTTGAWNNSTDPSSENSSLDRVHGIMKPVQTPEPMNNYGLDGFGNDAILEEGLGSDDYGIPANARRGPYGNGGGYGAANGVPPPPPAHSSSPRKTIQLGGADGGTDVLSSQGGQLPSAARVSSQQEKRKSWLGRKFSRKD